MLCAAMPRQKEVGDRDVPVRGGRGVVPIAVEAPAIRTVVGVRAGQKTAIPCTKEPVYSNKKERKGASAPLNPYGVIKKGATATFQYEEAEALSQRPQKRPQDAPLLALAPARRIVLAVASVGVYT